MVLFSVSSNEYTEKKWLGEVLFVLFVSLASNSNRYNRK
jgi:hypothetical protein